MMLVLLLHLQLYMIVFLHRCDGSSTGILLSLKIRAPRKLNSNAPPSFRSCFGLHGTHSCLFFVGLRISSSTYGTQVTTWPPNWSAWCRKGRGDLWRMDSTLTWLVSSYFTGWNWITDKSETCSSVFASLHVLLFPCICTIDMMHMIVCEVIAMFAYTLHVNKMHGFATTCTAPILAAYKLKRKQSFIYQCYAPLPS